MKPTIKSIAAAIVTTLVLQLTVQVQNTNAQTVASTPYTWKSVQMVGGGFVPGIVFHPKAKDVCYCRTDMGGAYRWNDAIKRWEPLLDWLSYEDVNLMGVESIALDPNDPDRNSKAVLYSGLNGCFDRNGLSIAPTVSSGS